MLAIVSEGGWRVARFAGPALDAALVAACQAPLLQAARQQPPLVVDLAAVGYLDLFGVELLLKAVRVSDGTLRFVGVSLEVADLLRRHDVLPVLRVAASLADLGPPS